LGSVLKGNGEPYTVFTPYSRRWKASGPLSRQDLLAPPASLPPVTAVATEALPQLGNRIAEIGFCAGEPEAVLRLESFMSHSIHQYAEGRNRADLDGTARLSPYFRFGMLSPRFAAVMAFEALAIVDDKRAMHAQHERTTGATSAQLSIETWLSELIWRDFYITILRYFPHVRGASFRSQYDAIQWNNDVQDFQAWQTGMTGYPVVDAAMRQLHTTGWIHNRLRMVVASFLVKDLLIDWRWGERWFMQQLLDGDPAANNGGWQWSAGTGTDAAPYFRIFNPVSQSKKVDPEGNYIRRWVPELAKVERTWIHAPWNMPLHVQRSVNCKIGEDYPGPIVDHEWARERTLAAFRRAHSAYVARSRSACVARSSEPGEIS
jgi:deoxyribodipyrimidine photo-lyase